MAARLIRSTTYSGGKVRLPPGAQYQETKGGKHVYHLPGTELWFLVQPVPGGWVVHELDGGCDC